MTIKSDPRDPQTARRIAMRALWRLTGWGVGAALSLTVLVLVTQTDSGSERLKLALAPADLPSRHVAVVPVPPPAGRAELARLQAQVRSLTAARERLTERVAVLENGLTDLTGSIKKQIAAVTAKQEKAATPPPAVAAPPVIAPPAVTPHEAPTAAATPKQEMAKAEPPAAMTKEAETPQQPAVQEPAPHRVAVPLPPVRMAAIPPKPEFGIALAGASNLTLLHMQWAALNANFGPLLGGLKPHVLREKRGPATHYRLIVGPMPTYTAAAKLCARLIAARAVCHPVKMAGTPL